MSDQGWGQPQFNQPGQGGQSDPPPPPSGPPPQYGPPSQTGQPAYGQPSYGQPQPPAYGPPSYGQPSYGQPQQPAYGQPAYGQPQAPGQPAYGQPAYGQPPQGYGAAYGTPQGGGSKKGLLFGGLGVLVVAAIVVVLFATGVFSGSSDNGGGSPSAAVSHFLSAVKSGDTSTARSLQCAQDRSNPDLKLTGSHIVSFSVGRTKRTDSTHSSVATTVRSSGTSKASTVELPVVKEGGGWKVCFSDLAGLGGGDEQPGSGEATPVPAAS